MYTTQTHKHVHTHTHTDTHTHTHTHTHYPTLPLLCLSIFPSITANNASHGHSLESNRLSSLDLRNSPGLTMPRSPILVAMSWCSSTSQAVMEVGTTMHSNASSFFLLKNTTKTCSHSVCVCGGDNYNVSKHSPSPSV